MISNKSILIFFYINGSVLLLNYFVYYFDIFFISFLLRNYLLMMFIEFGTHQKEMIDDRPNCTYSLKDHLGVCSSALIESLTYKMIPLGACSWSHFLIHIFCFELVLDFFHYWTHRMIHVVPELYVFHKYHHYHNRPRTLNTYCHHPMDLVLTNTIPTLISFYFFRFSRFQSNLVLIYKSFIEISGHVGRKLAPSSCFPLCIWLPRALGIELYTEDHDLHHSKSTFNYSKRFCIWDQLFGTLF
jgi:sterol desaturase/sphingolipid hydroxylase (fatty acid hydroxylase superfamily)